jgi:hypothetical protein
MQFIKKYSQEIEESRYIWQEILDGDFSNYEKITFLLDSVVKSLTEYKGWLELRGLKSFTDEQVEHLSKHKGGLDLRGLIRITSEQKKIWSKYEEGLILSDLLFDS